MFNFKELFAGVVLIFLLGIGGFLYRVAMESSYQNIPISTSGHPCTSTQCLTTNVKLPNVGISFTLPVEYALVATSTRPNSALVATYVKGEFTNATSTISDVINIYRYALAKGRTADEIMRKQTVFTPSGLSPLLMKEFTNITLNGNTFSRITIERLGGVVQTAYYITHAQSIFRFDITEHGVADWANPTLDAGNLQGNKTLHTLLSTLQFSAQHTTPL